MSLCGVVHVEIIGGFFGLTIPINVVLDQGFIFLGLTENFTFSFQEIYPSITLEIIYIGNVVHLLT